MNARTILASFTAVCRSHGEPGGLRLARWSGASSRTANMLTLTGPKGCVVFYVKVRAEGSGFWGLTYTQINSLRSCRLPWFVVLLLGPNETAYLLPAALVERAIASDTWSAGKWDFKVHDNHEVEGALRFDFYEDLCDVLVAACAIT